MSDPSKDADASGTNTLAGSGRHRYSLFTLVLSTLFSGVGAAVIAALLAHDTVPVQTRTVKGPTQIVYRYATVDSGEPCSGTKVATGPPYEPNDLAAEAYGPLRARVPYDATLEGSGDVDFYAFCVAQPEIVTIRIAQTGCGHSDFACGSTTNVALLGDGGAELRATDIDSETTVASLTRQLAPGRYFIRVYYNDDYEYELRVLPHTGGLSSTLPK